MDLEKEGGGLLRRLGEVDQRGDGHPREDLRGFAERGYSRVLVLVVGRVVYRQAWPFTAVLSVCLVAFLPLLLVLPVLEGTSALLFGVAAGVNNAVMVALALVAWRSVPELAGGLSELLDVSPERGGFVRWLNGRLGLGRQLVAGAAGAGVTVGLIYAVSRQNDSPLVVSGGLYVLAVWSGVLGGNVVYWLYTAAEVPIRLGRCGGLRLAWLDPAHTPVIVKLCGTYARIAASMGLGVLLVEGAALAIAAPHPPALMQVFVIGFPVFAVVTALYVGVQPYVTLSRIVRRHIDRIVAPLMAQMTAPPSDLLLRDDLDAAFRTYTHFRTLRHLPVKTGPLLQYAAGILASLTAFLVQRALT